RLASAVEWLTGEAQTPGARRRSLSAEGRTYRGTASAGGCRGSMCPTQIGGSTLRAEGGRTAARRALPCYPEPDGFHHCWMYPFTNWDCLTVLCFLPQLDAEQAADSCRALGADPGRCPGSPARRLRRLRAATRRAPRRGHWSPRAARPGLHQLLTAPVLRCPRR